MKTTHSKDGRIMAKSNPRKAELVHRRDAPLETRTDLTREATRDISGAMNAILADVFALYLKTKNFHWHMSGHHFRDYHLLLDEHAEQLFAMTDPIRSECHSGGRFRALFEDEKFPLAHERPSLPRLSPASRRTRGATFRHDRPHQIGMPFWRTFSRFI